MAEARLLDPDEHGVDARHQTGALDLARRPPSLVVAATDVAATVMYGVHGRRRAGVGETFWQFRPFVWGEETTRIDWRRSARDHRVYVREREWEAAHTIWLWMDRSPSMAYVSSLALQSKIARALTLPPPSRSSSSRRGPPRLCEEEGNDNDSTWTALWPTPSVGVGRRRDGTTATAKNEKKKAPQSWRGATDAAA